MATHSLALAGQGLDLHGKRVELMCIGMALTGKVVQRSAKELHRSAKELRRVVLFRSAMAKICMAKHWKCIAQTGFGIAETRNDWRWRGKDLMSKGKALHCEAMALRRVDRDGRGREKPCGAMAQQGFAKRRQRKAEH